MGFVKCELKYLKRAAKRVMAKELTVNEAARTYHFPIEDIHNMIRFRTSRHQGKVTVQ